jgi:hypothetical protein
LIRDATDTASNGGKPGRESSVDIPMRFLEAGEGG